MTPFYLNPPPLPHVEGNQGEEDHLLLTTPTSQTSSSSFPVCFSLTQEQENYEGHDQPLLCKGDQADARFWTGGSGEQNMIPISLPNVDRHHYNSCIKPSLVGNRKDHQYVGPCDHGQVDWMSSNMRFMTTTMKSEQTITNEFISYAQMCPNYMQSRCWDHEKSNNSTTNVIRVCADCNTTKTPLWRSGPRGPKSLCNACGIRRRKARRALAAAANGGLVPDDPLVNRKVPKEKRSEGDCTSQLKKRCKVARTRTKKKLRFDDFKLSKNSAFQRVFPEDERDAAILLMALSYGLVRS